LLNNLTLEIFVQVLTRPLFRLGRWAKRQLRSLSTIIEAHRGFRLNYSLYIGLLGVFFLKAHRTGLIGAIVRHFRGFSIGLLGALFKAALRGL
jgi:hypothetical protein